MLNQIDLSRTDLNLLALFEIVLEEQHVGRAAERLRLSPSAVSHGLGRLRRLLNDPLFLRTPKGVVPTARATELSEPIADILARARNVISSAAPFDAATVDAPLHDRLGRRIFDFPAGADGRAGADGARYRHRDAAHAAGDRHRRSGHACDRPGGSPVRRYPCTAFRADALSRRNSSSRPAAGIHSWIRQRSPTTARCAICMIAPRGDPRGPVDDLLRSSGLSRRIVLAVPNFMLGIEVISKTDLISMLPKRFVAMHAERFGIAWVTAPVSVGRQPVMAVAPKVAMMDAGIAWLFDILAAGCRPPRTLRAPGRRSTRPSTCRTGRIMPRAGR